MAKMLLLLFGVIIFQQCSKAAPSESTQSTPPIVLTNAEGDERLGGELNIEIKPPIATDDVRLDNESHGEKKPPINTDASQNQRLKRQFDFSGFEYSPFDLPALSYPSQPHYTKRDGAHNTAVYGEDPLNIIFRRLNNVLNAAKDIRYQNAARPVQPAYIPIFYMQPFGCGCNTHNQGPSPPVNPATTHPLPPTNTDRPVFDTNSNSSFKPSLPNRGSFDDKTQNWGVVTDKPINSDVGIKGDGNRPINFDPILPNEPMEVPAPPVEHGTVQAGAEPAENPNQVTPPKAARLPDSNYLPGASAPAPVLIPSNSENSKPSLCDGAIITCCNQNPIVNKCFESRGCENPYIYGNPCDPKVQLRVINKFRDFQNRRAG